MYVRGRSELQEEVIESRFAHKEKRIKLQNQIGVEDSTHSRVDSWQLPYYRTSRE